MLLGSSNGVLTVQQWLRVHAESILLVVYTISITVYLSWVAWRDQFRHVVFYSFFGLLHPRHRNGAATAIPSSTSGTTARETESTPPLQASSVDSTLLTPAMEKPTATETIVEDSKSPPVATTAAEILPVAETTAITNLSGAYRLLSNTGFEEFLAVQGVPWALRRAANGARPIHRITQNGRQLTIRIEGIIESQTTYMIGGPPVETNVRGRIFEDSVEYYGRGIRVNKRALTENYDVTVVRQLSEDGKHITMTSTATFRDEREPVQCVQLFERFE